MKEFLSKSQEDNILQVIAAAELQTSGEIKVHIESECNYELPLERAIEVFNQLKMNETQERNGVIIYVATNSKKFAIYGDSGINKVVPTNFWNEVAAAMKGHFADSNFAEGISRAIYLCGEKLKTFFPYNNNDTNELTNDISFGK